MKYNFIGIKNGVFSWRQIELRGGKTYMRMKKRPFVTVRETC